MTSQDQRLDGSQIEDSQVQLVQAGQDAVSFQNSHDNQVTINTVILRLFGHATPPPVDWDWAKRLCLRIVPWRSGVAPRNLARFLNYCVERKLLQRVGGRYRFLHRELLDYFANQQTSPSQPPSPTRKERFSAIG